MHHHGRSNYHTSSDNTRQDQINGAASTSDGANEHTSLLHNGSNGSRPAIQALPLAFLKTTWEVLKSNFANVLLVVVPLGIIAGAAGWDPVPTFILNFLAIVPLAGLLSFATEELSAKLGQTVGGLMNATFGNAVELIVSIVALREGQIRIVQASMLGSILSNILLVSRLMVRRTNRTFLTTAKGSRLLLHSEWD